MNIKTMKFIDEVFGPPVCFCFYWYNLIKQIFTPRYKIDPSKANNILLIKFFGMGSIILAGPLLRALREKFPNAKITILTFSNNKEICQRIELIDEVIAVTPSSFLTFITQTAKSIMYVRSKRCEISIDLEFFAKSSALIQYLCNAKVRVGYYIIQQGILLRMLWRGELFTHNVYYNPHRHTSEAFLALARKIGADTNDLSPANIKIYDEDRECLNKLLSAIGLGQKGHFIAMNINASPLCLERRWPIEKFAELTRQVLSNYNFKIVLIGNTQDIPYVNIFVKMLKDEMRLINLAGKLNIGMLATLLERAKVFITNDSGPLHIAATMGTATVSIFGPEIPERYAPIGQRHTVFYSGVYCSPCLNAYNQKIAPCKGENECVRRIAVENVYNALVGQL